MITIINERPKVSWAGLIYRTQAYSQIVHLGGIVAVDNHFGNFADDGEVMPCTLCCVCGTDES